MNGHLGWESSGVDIFDKKVQKQIALETKNKSVWLKFVYRRLAACSLPLPRPRAGGQLNCLKLLVAIEEGGTAL